jgi:predicted small secreted protein
MRLTICLALLVLGTLPLTGCNTMNGLGKDLESAGKTIQNS